MNKRFLSNKSKWHIVESLEYCIDANNSNPIEYASNANISYTRMDGFLKIMESTDLLSCDKIQSEYYPRYIELATMAHLSNMSDHPKVKAALKDLQDEESIIKLHSAQSE